MTALALPTTDEIEHRRNVLRMGYHMAHAQADAQWLWIVKGNFEADDVNPQSAAYKQAVYDYDLAAVRVRLFTERLLTKLGARRIDLGGKEYERYEGRVGFHDEHVTVEYHRAIHMVTARID
jgi:hypothetical protein